MIKYMVTLVALTLLCTSYAYAYDSTSFMPTDVTITAESSGGGGLGVDQSWYKYSSSQRNNNVTYYNNSGSPIKARCVCPSGYWPTVRGYINGVMVAVDADQPEYSPYHSSVSTGVIVPDGASYKFYYTGLNGHSWGSAGCYVMELR